MKPIRILLVEDDPGDVLLIEDSFRDSKVVLDLHHVDTGLKALQFLRRQAPYEDAVIPEMILLDLNLPAIDGLTVLNEIKADPDIRPIPVVILTTSEAREHVDAAYHGGASCYIIKPLELKDFEKMVSNIEDFWLTVVKLPPPRHDIV